MSINHKSCRQQEATTLLGTPYAKQSLALSSSKYYTSYLLIRDQDNLMRPKQVQNICSLLQHFILQD